MGRFDHSFRDWIPKRAGWRLAFDHIRKNARPPPGFFFCLLLFSLYTIADTS